MFVIALAATVLWLGVLLAPWRPWSTIERLDPKPDETDDAVDTSSVTAIVPARDEAPTIARTIAGLRRQDARLRIIVVDDQSTDGTADVVRATCTGECEVVAGTPMPAGWVGKLWALEQGMRCVRTPFALLVDADIELEPGVLAALLRQRRAGDRQLVSLMAVLDMQTRWAKLLGPAFVYFFKLLYPFRLSNGPGRLIAAAAGGCILVETDTLGKAGGLAGLRGALIDDCALAAAIKRGGGRTWIGLSHAVISHRPMRTLATIWRMVERSAFAQLRYSTALLAACVALLGLAFWVPVIGLCAGDHVVRLLALLALVAMVTTYVPTLTFYRRAWPWALTLPFVGTLYLLMTLTSALHHWRGRGAVWKGRAYGMGRARELG